MLDEGHADEISDFSTEEAAFFVEAHGALERLGGIEGDARAPFGDQVFAGVTRESRTAASARALTKSGNHTGESQGTGIRNSTSGSLSERGHLTVAQSAA